ncbi:XRE family transcriptional regulator [Muribacter muris]|uniref:XRE family transcriptional regulator n=1 Tax=Muribacter muris TaxID=67855 RepID=A0A4Y9K4I0_9PAST|nr:helix-turn-helix transcriptional regulator [Muribacter muris]MBF0784304.1 helix-turn-helix transcriptional regulator [Muribacter muris]MBF0826959.1 helix-turn-helix transcriptional regulator [Muribacter muris]TFV13041.1 XRE family transcriptional regulator [Muribacter muris]
MNVQEKIRAMREIKHWSQEEMAEKLAMSPNGYARIERGESKLNLERLQQIANIFNIDLIELMTSNEKGLICLISENSDYSSNYYAGDEKIILENEKLKLIIEHKNELISQQKSEISALKEIITLLKTQNH